MLSKKKKSGRIVQVTLLKPVYGASTSKGPNITGYEEFDNDSTPYVRWMDKLGNNTIEADQLLHVQQAIVTMHYREDLRMSSRIVKDSKMYAIHSFSETGESMRRDLVATVEYVMDYVIT